MTGPRTTRTKTTTKKKDPAAVSLGRRGALKRWGNRPTCPTCGRPLPMPKQPAKGRT
jgi:hypothetical protein